MNAPLFLVDRLAPPSRSSRSTRPRSPSLARVEFPRSRSTSTERFTNRTINSSIRWMRVGAGWGGTPWGVTHPRLRPIERTRDRRTDGRTVHIYTRETKHEAWRILDRDARQHPRARRRRPGGATRHISTTTMMASTTTMLATIRPSRSMRAMTGRERERARATRCGSRASVDDDRRGTHHVR